MASPQIISPQPPMSLGAVTKCTPDSFDARTTALQSGGYFAFARIKGEICLVQVSYATPASALTTVDIKLFRHEFISIFRFAENRTLHPADISIVEPIDDRLTRYEEENETVFLARDLMERMRKLTDPRRNMGINRARHSQMQIQRQRQR